MHCGANKCSNDRAVHCTVCNLAEAGGRCHWAQHVGTKCQHCLDSVTVVFFKSLPMPLLRYRMQTAFCNPYVEVHCNHEKTWAQYVGTNCQHLLTQ